jgi:hypothetical protein
MMCLLNNKMAAVSAANVQLDNDASGPDSWAVSIPGEPPARGLPVGSTTVKAAAATIIYSDGSAASLQHLASTMETTMTKAKGNSVLHYPDRRQRRFPQPTNRYRR